MGKKILVVDDEPIIVKVLDSRLKANGYDVITASDGQEALTKARADSPDLIVLDVMLPKLDGWEILRRLRRAKSTPVLMLTAKTSELDRVLGLEVGADDYLSKPFSVPELVARVNAILRRSGEYQADPGADESAALQCGGLFMDPGARRVRIDDADVDLTAREFDLLWHFARNPGRAFTRTQLLNSVWGYGHDGYEHTVNSHINRLRAKIESDPSKPKYILTVWGVGYKFSPEHPRGHIA